MSGNDVVIDTLFRLRFLADGASAEKIDIILGNTIVPYTLVFLKTFDKYAHFISRPDSLVANPGPDYVDDFDKQFNVIKIRYEAIRKIPRSEVPKAVDRCLSMLESEMKDLNKNIEAN